MKRLFNLMLVILLIVLITSISSAQIPRTISFQGILTDTLGNPVGDGQWAINFRLYDAEAGGNQLWAEAKVHQTKRGLFSTNLGDVIPFGASVIFDKPYWLALQAGGQPEMLPRIPLTAVGYSFNSLKSDTAIVASTIPDGIVTESKILDNTVSSAKIVDGTITSSDLADASISSEKIAPDQVVKSLNGLRNQVYLSAVGGATVNSSNDTIYINAGSGGGGTGIQGVQNTNNTLTITDPNGPTATVNLKVPLSLSDSIMNTTFERGVFKASNFGSASAIYGVQTGSGKAIYGLGTGTGRAGVFTIDNASNTQVALTGQTDGSGTAVYGLGTGTGKAGQFTINNASNAQVALTGQTNGSGTAVYGYQTGTGMASHLQISNSSNNMPVIRAETNGSGVPLYAYQTGLGMGAHIHVNNASNNANALYVQTVGNGNGIYSRVGGTGDAVYAYHTGSGDGIYANHAGSGNAIYGRAGTGRAGYFHIASGTNNNPAVLCETYGDGEGLYARARGGGSSITGYTSESASRAGWFEIANAANANSALVGKTSGSGNAIAGQNFGSGRAGLFQIDNAANSAHAMYVTTNGTGRAGYFRQLNPASTAHALYVGHVNANARALSVDGQCYIEGYTYINDNLIVNGTVGKAGGTFKIDHPLDPENKYLYHSFVESPDMMNIYNGNITLNDKGEAVVQLPDWFGALNKEFRYQLTAIGAPGPNLFVASEVDNNQFKISGGTSGMKVSWQVTGIRKDAWAEKNRFRTEEDKTGEERGRYLHPEVFGKTREEGIGALKMPKPSNETMMDEENLSSPKPPALDQKAPPQSDQE